MKYKSTTGSEQVTFKDAVLNGLAPDQGLYVPSNIPALNSAFLKGLSLLTLQEIALAVALPFIEDEIPRRNLRTIVESAISFDAPVVTISENCASLELFHGPTLAFKDFGARFMAAVVEYYQSFEAKSLTVLVATSGDTGGAVGSGFHGRSGIRVVILYPKDKVSPLQEKQLTTLGDNVTAVRVNGTFDDCQALVKGAFGDRRVSKKLSLTSANSINIARLIPQTFYYFSAMAQTNTSYPIVVSVPSGNFGNLTAGLYARRMGLGISRFLACTNVNDVVPKYLNTGIYSPAPSIATIANAMDVGNPSNFARMYDLCDGNAESLRSMMTGYSFEDAQIREGMKRIYESTSYICDPHGAVAYLGLQEYLSKNKDAYGIFLHTAHPAKFQDVVRPIVGEALVVPSSLEALADKTGTFVDMGNSAEELCELLVN